MSTTTTTRAPRVPRDERPISERQENYIARLRDERDLSGAAASVTQALVRVDALSNQAAGDLIDALMSLPIKPEHIPSEPGYYLRDGVVFQVVANKRGTSTYAKRVTIRGGKIRFDYDPEAGRAFGDKALTVKAVRAAAVKAGATKADADSKIV
jgi:hypothetical protein